MRNRLAPNEDLEDRARCQGLPGAKMGCQALPGRCACVVLGLAPPLARKAPRQPVHPDEITR